MTKPNAFDPKKHLTKLSGKPYLEVKWRIVWLRSEFPNSTIETECIERNASGALFRSRVTRIDADGVLHGSATGYGSETPGDFKDYIEKAETKATGRALAALGYGTETAPDFEPEYVAGERTENGHQTFVAADRAPDTRKGRSVDSGATSRKSEASPKTDKGPAVGPEDDRHDLATQETLAKVGKLQQALGQDERRFWLFASGALVDKGLRDRQRLTQAEAEQLIPLMENLVKAEGRK